MHGEVVRSCINPLNNELNPICHSLALLAYHILHISRVKVNVLVQKIYITADSQSPNEEKQQENNFKQYLMQLVLVMSFLILT
jgi:hypothetical protein